MEKNCVLNHSLIHPPSSFDTPGCAKEKYKICLNENDRSTLANIETSACHISGWQAVKRLQKAVSSLHINNKNAWATKA